MHLIPNQAASMLANQPDRQKPQQRDRNF